MAKRYRLPLFATRIGLPNGSKEAYPDGWFYPNSAEEESALEAAGCQVDDLSDPNDYFGLISAEQAAALQVLLGEDYSVVYAGVRGSTLEYSTQVRGAADTSQSLGGLGFSVNAASNAAASTAFSLNQADYISPVNGASPAGNSVFLGPYPTAVLRVHFAELGLNDPYTLNDSGPVLGASGQMGRLVWDVALDVRAVLAVEGPPTNFAGVAGTGSARSVSIFGLRRAT